MITGTALPSPKPAEVNATPESLDFLSESETPQSPALSATGKRRLKENLEILDNNLRDLRKNLAAADKNLGTIRAELKDLQTLEKEHLDLKKKYQQFQATAELQMKKNQKAGRNLAKWEESTHPQANDPQAKNKVESAKTELLEREDWQKDTEKKLAQVKSLLAGVETNLVDIRSRKKPLEQQLSAWNSRRDEYRKLISETETRKSKWQRVLER